MNDGAGIDRFVKDPSKQEAQLRAIAKAVEYLEISGVGVPDPLRAEKTRLAASLAMHADAKQALVQLADDFQDILSDLRGRSGPDAPLPKAKPRGKSSKSPMTSRKVLREHIVRALKRLGGSARAAEVIAEMGRHLEGKLLPGDTVRRESTNDYAWQNNANWERLRMTKDDAQRLAARCLGAGGR